MTYIWGEATTYGLHCWRDREIPFFLSLSATRLSDPFSPRSSLSYDVYKGDSREAPPIAKWYRSLACQRDSVYAIALYHTSDPTSILYAFTNPHKYTYTICLEAVPKIVLKPKDIWSDCKILWGNNHERFFFLLHAGTKMLAWSSTVNPVHPDKFIYSGKNLHHFCISLYTSRILYDRRSAFQSYSKRECTYTSFCFTWANLFPCATRNVRVLDGIRISGQSSASKL